jgi:hypothetical protein
MKRVLFILLVILLAVISCKREKKFVEPEYIFSKWARSIENLNYIDYASCEAYPKSEPVFREMFRESYYADLMVTEIEKFDEKKIKKDGKGDSFVSRNVRFECTEIRRRDKKPVRILRGDVDFIKFIEGDRTKQGWLMWNRKIIRFER